MIDTALLVIDVQNAFFQAPKPLYNADGLIRNIRALIDQAHTARVPVIYVQTNAVGDLAWMNDTPLRDIHSAIAPAASDLVIQKTSNDAFEDTSLRQELDNRRITKVIIAGCQTEYCINNSVRSAAALGYAVTLIRDAQGTFDSDTQTAAQIVDQYSQALSAVATVCATNEWIGAS